MTDYELYRIKLKASNKFINGRLKSILENEKLGFLVDFW